MALGVQGFLQTTVIFLSLYIIYFNHSLDEDKSVFLS